MARNENAPRRLRGYYGFSKKYPSRRGDRPIHETPKAKKRERAKKILGGVLLVCLFVFTFIFAKFCYNLSTRPLPQQEENTTPTITADNLGTIRATYIDNDSFGELDELSKKLNEAKSNGFNAVVLDFKTREGILTYHSDLISYGAELNIIDSFIIEKIKSEGFIIIGSVYCFEDTIAPQRIGAYVYEDAEKTKIWFDAPAINGGRVWLDPTNPRATNYICSVIKEVVNLGVDCIYLQSVEFPVAQNDTKPVYMAEDATLNRNLVLMQFMESVVAASNNRPVILGMPLECATDGDAEKWGGTLFDTAAPICSPVLVSSSGSDYISFIENTYIVMNDKVKNNFSTIKVIPTVKNQYEDPDFYEKISKSSAESYIILP
ncbi:MAG: hypothetical protein IKW45_05035 [Clostridia bacterium]|nr:hypothetical protein [Clostridia bacterium]